MRLPARIAEELNNPAPRGGRHAQMVHLVLPLLGNWQDPDRVFDQFRDMYDSHVTDQEIWSVIEWGESKDPEPCYWQEENENDEQAEQSKPEEKSTTMKRYYKHYSNGQSNHDFAPAAKRLKAAQISAATSFEEAVRNAQDFLDGLQVSEPDLRKRSRLEIPSDWSLRGGALLQVRFKPEALVCINTHWQTNGQAKVIINGPGETMTADRWLWHWKKYGMEQGKQAGAWIRINPLIAEKGSGESGAHTDDDVSEMSCFLIESDKLPREFQLPLLCSLDVPILAIIDSGAASYHAWATTGAVNRAQYAREVEEAYLTLARFKIDCGNSNPSRYSRLPGVSRHVNGQVRHQNLLYLNPDPEPEPIIP
jgi:hypothetical protein